MNENKRSHSVPVPRLYKESANIRKKVNEGEGLNHLIYGSKCRNLKAVYALVCTSLRNDSLLNSILDQSGILNEKFDPDLAKILVTELLWGKKTLYGESIPVQITLSFQSKLQKAAESSELPVTHEPVVKPRYVRVNTLRTTIKGTTRSLVDDGWELLDTPETYENFLQCIGNLDMNQFMKDFHFEDILVFPAKTELHSHKLVEKGSLILQDKASYLPAQLLNPEPGSIVLDMCAAPGIKTSHLASLMENKGTLYAVDRDPKRHTIMVDQIVSFCGVHSCVECKVADSTQLSSRQLPGVQYILVDPSCSGTGMSKRIEDLNDRTVGANSRRIRNLAGFQERLLIQALTAFPDVVRVVYSTCSVLEEENEKVVDNVLARIPEFHVVPPKLNRDWEHRGNSDYSFGSNCLVADIETDLTNGFFVAVLERIAESEATTEKVLKRKSTTADDEGWEFPKKRNKQQKKKKEKKASHMDVGTDEEAEVNT